RLRLAPNAHRIGPIGMSATSLCGRASDEMSAVAVVLSVRGRNEYTEAGRNLHTPDREGIRGQKHPPPADDDEHGDVGHRPGSQSHRGRSLRTGGWYQTGRARH